MIRVRSELRPGDLGAVIRMHGLLYAGEHGWDHTFEGYVAEGIGRFAVSCDPARERLWLAEDGEVLAGSIAIVEREAGVAQLRWFLVDPAVRGRGVGRLLLDESLAFARSCGYGRVILETVAGLDTAARLYREAGFSLVREAHVEQWGARLTEQVYALHLSDPGEA